jgi:DNA-binding transcriptional ArsR family regulator
MPAASTKPARADRKEDFLFRALADASRRKILRLLAERELPLHQIEARFDMSRPAVIKHVRVLQSCGLVQARREGRRTIHRLDPAPLKAVKDWVATFDAFWDERLARLKRQVEGEA